MGDRVSVFLLRENGTARITSTHLDSEWPGFVKVGSGSSRQMYSLMARPLMDIASPVKVKTWEEIEDYAPEPDFDSSWWHTGSMSPQMMYAFENDSLFPISRDEITADMKMVEYQKLDNLSQYLARGHAEKEAFGGLDWHMWAYLIIVASIVLLAGIIGLVGLSEYVASQGNQ